ncbi:MAG: DUF4197 domain-containing protein [Gemmatimonadetes bacterium]|nr:DUF4197 domain-containing protein [Gemmatimonadota bacterium]
MKATMKQGRALAAAGSLLVISGCGTVNTSVLEDILAGTGTAGGALSESTIIAGLRQALEVGTERTVSTTSRVDGFFGNPLIRIPVPTELLQVATTLRGVGLGGKVDEFELAMNRAAEQASGEAVGVFWSAIKSMSIQDARGILNGPDNAATSYFQGRTEAELETRFRPIVDAKMQELGYVKKYEELADAYAALPLTTRPAFDPEAYVTDRALDGLFKVLEGEEKKIRDDPAARTTELLRQVFGATS